jgi:MoxR-like ATPase
LLDEIDKAEPDLPNDLLGPLGDREVRISIPTLGERQARTPVLIVLTTNGERDMPPAFLRRCLHLELPPPGKDFLVDVATAHEGEDAAGLYRAVAEEMEAIRQRARAAGRREPSTAEFLDTVRACREFGERPGSPLWTAISEVALTKHRPDCAGGAPDEPDVPGHPDD